MRLKRKPGKAFRKLVDLLSLYHFNQTIRVNPNHQRARKYLASWHLQQARTLSGQKQWDEARHHYTRVIQLLPDAPQAYNELGEILLAHGQTDQVLDHFRGASRLKPDFEHDQKNLRFTNED